MNTKVTIENLAVWIRGIKECAKQDVVDQVFWFVPTMSKPFNIVAGWHKMFKEDYSDLFCCSKSQPEYVMCLKIVENPDLVCPDFDSLNMPIDSSGNVDDTCIPLEWDDSTEAAATFFLCEWERIMNEHKEKI